MEARDSSSNTRDLEVVEILSAEPVAEAAMSDVVEAVPGVVLAREPVANQTSPQTPLREGEGWGEEEESDQLPLHKNGQLKNVLECMLFVSTEPLSAKQLAEALGVEEEKVEDAMCSLEDRLETSSGLQLMRVAGGYQLCTRAEYADYCAIILQPARKKLSKAALETLAVVAYRQPCTMPEIEAVRGVSVDGVIKTLMERGLVKEAGRKQTPGRPILYATTPEFLEYFGLNDISELPDIDMLAVEEIKALEAQRELFKSQPDASEPKEETEETPEDKE